MLAVLPVSCAVPSSAQGCFRAAAKAVSRGTAQPKSKRRKTSEQNEDWLDKAAEAGAATGAGGAAAGALGALGAHVVDGGARYVRFLYVKPHSGKVQSGASAAADSDDSGAEDAPSTLFVANVGATWTDEDVRGLFAHFGKVSRVDVGRTRQCRFARVTFQHGKGLLRVMERTKGSKADVPLEMKPLGAEPGATASSSTSRKRRPAWIDRYEEACPGLDALKRETEAYMEKFANLEEAEEERRKELEKQADADGFTMVTPRKGAKRRMPAVALPSNAKGPGDRYVTTQQGTTWKLEADLKGKHKKKELQNFYRFQVREKKRDKLAELRDKFEQDKQHIARLKAASSHFKPF